MASKTTIVIVDNYSERDKKYAAYAEELGFDVKWLDIWQANWPSRLRELEEKAGAFFWHSRDRGKYVREHLLDYAYFITQYTGRPIFPDYNQYYCFNDKVKQAALYEKFQIPTPVTFYTQDKNQALAYASEARYPFVLKDPHSSACLGVYLVKSEDEAREKISRIFSSQGLNSLTNIFYAQEFLPGLDRKLRIVTLGPEVYSAYWCVNKNDWIHNAGPGTYISDKNIPDEAYGMAREISAKLGYHWMAYDMMCKDGKFYVLEMSCNFGSTGLKQLGKNIEKDLIGYVAKQITEKN
jgi:ribosomal protein S6--L-glutamate ligase